MTRPLTRSTTAATLARSFLIQGSWNYRAMLGSGFAFVMLPALRTLYRGDPAALDAALGRHLEHFNAHPYLANVAVGAALRLEADGVDDDTIRRFKGAVRGPLGSLGDSLVWATWLPGVSVVALVLYGFGVPLWAVVGLYLGLYNVLHVGLRIWGLRVGLESGKGVARRLGDADFNGWVTRLQPVLALLIGLLCGVLLGGAGGLVESGAGWALFAGATFLAGLFLGHRAWRPAAVVTVVAVALIATAGVIR